MVTLYISMIVIQGAEGDRRPIRQGFPQDGLVHPQEVRDEAQLREGRQFGHGI